MGHSFGNSNSQDGVIGSTAGPNASGVVGRYEVAIGRGGRQQQSPPLPLPSGVMGIHHGSTHDGGSGVHGESDTGVGVQGNGPEAGVKGLSNHGAGVNGHSDHGVGVKGEGPEAGVSGHSNSGTGVRGFTDSPDQNAIFGMNTSPGPAHEGLNRPAGSGVWGHSMVQNGAGVVGSVDATLSDAIGIVGIGTIAAKFFGDVEVTGDIKLNGSDLAERFTVHAAQTVEPGTVLIIDDDGQVRESTQPYDRRVIGVIAGAGDCRPGVILNGMADGSGSWPVTLVGKAFCKVDTTNGPIRPGDLLTTSALPGHAMKAVASQSAFGAVIGKALGRLAEGKALVPVLIALQ
jgi:hypothetical protein